MRKRRATSIVLINLAVLIALIAIVEGASSLMFVGARLLQNRTTAERAHTEYDAELGWINLPRHHVADMYGPGVSLTTNSQRYRNRRDFGETVPPGKVRIICSGDSFTLGYGVADDQTWCHLLTAMDQRLETVNLGQGGYGVDQAYLWYQRNKSELEHDVHAFAFIGRDFQRMQSDKFVGYGKPYLTLLDGDLSQVNYPVPKFSYYVPWLITDLRTLARLKSVELVSKIHEKLVGTEDPLTTAAHEQAEIVASEIFAKLQRTNREKQSVFVLVYLPTLEDYMGEKLSEFWRTYVKAQADQNGYHLIDIVPELRRVPPDQVNELFRGHYSADGNKFVAEALYRKLSEIPEIRRRLRQVVSGELPADSLPGGQRSGGLLGDQLNDQ